MTSGWSSLRSGGITQCFPQNFDFGDHNKNYCTGGGGEVGLESLGVCSQESSGILESLRVHCDGHFQADWGI